jgi:copper chaperone
MRTPFILSSLVFSFLFLSLQTLCGEKEKLKLTVQGMHCTSCVSMVKKSVRKISGVESVSVDLDSGTVEVVCDSASTRCEAVAHAIQRMGYKVLDSDSTKNNLGQSPHIEQR